MTMKSRKLLTLGVLPLAVVLGREAGDWSVQAGERSLNRLVLAPGQPQTGLPQLPNITVALIA
jgi:hypothetical protein